MICGNMVGGLIPLKTLILVDENGNEVVGTAVENLTIFDATAEDIKLGKVAATDSGVVTGTHICD